MAKQMKRTEIQLTTFSITFMHSTWYMMSAYLKTEWLKWRRIPANINTDSFNALRRQWRQHCSQEYLQLKKNHDWLFNCKSLIRLAVLQNKKITKQEAVFNHYRFFLLAAGASSLLEEASQPPSLCSCCWIKAENKTTSWVGQHDTQVL